MVPLPETLRYAGERGLTRARLGDGLAQLRGVEHGRLPRRGGSWREAALPDLRS